MMRLERLEQRAKDAVADCLIRHLVLPNVYFDAAWPGAENHVDVLAIDRAGSGDVHVVEVKGGSFDPKKTLAQLMEIPAQFRWLAAVKNPRQSRWPISGQVPSYLYPSDQTGRIGIIEVVRMSEDELGANIKFKAERFRGNLSQEVERFMSSHRPDIEFR
jgi:hypothetical protein